MTISRESADSREDSPQANSKERGLLECARADIVFVLVSILVLERELQREPATMPMEASDE